MSWTPIVKKTAAGAPVLVSVTKRGQLQALFRPAVLAEVSWIKVGASVSVLIGSGEHDGMLRITPGGTWLISPVTGKGSKSARIMMSVPSSIPAGTRAAVGVEYDYGDDWLELTLPAALRPPALAPSIRNDGAVIPKANGARFTMTDHVPDPATVLQQQRGGRVR